MVKEMFRGTWDVNLIQKKFIGMIENCELSEEQISSLRSFLVLDNRVLGLDNTKNEESNILFEEMKDSFTKKPATWIEPRTR